MPGMATNSKFRRVVDACPVERVPCCAEEGATEDDCHAVWLEHADILPDLSDAATVGCLLALVREAWNVKLCPIYFAGKYFIDLPTGEVFCQMTETEALVAALEAAP